jgi:Flp pilus assembly protein TadB
MSDTNKPRLRSSITERIWMVASCILLVTAAVFLWRNNLSAAFVTAALGACAWFLSYRAQLRAKAAADEESNEGTSAEESYED